eukprot:g11626.t1
MVAAATYLTSASHPPKTKTSPKNKGTTNTKYLQNNPNLPNRTVYSPHMEARQGVSRTSLGAFLTKLSTERNNAVGKGKSVPHRRFQKPDWIPDSVVNTTVSFEDKVGNRRSLYYNSEPFHNIDGMEVLASEFVSLTKPHLIDNDIEALDLDSNNTDHVVGINERENRADAMQMTHVDTTHFQNEVNIEAEANVFNKKSSKLKAKAPYGLYYRMLNEVGGTSKKADKSKNSSHNIPREKGIFPERGRVTFIGYGDDNFVEIRSAGLRVLVFRLY